MRACCKIASWADSKLQVSSNYLENYPDILKADKNVSMIDISKERQELFSISSHESILKQNIGIYQIYSKVMILRMQSLLYKVLMS